MSKTVHVQLTLQDSTNEEQNAALSNRITIGRTALNSHKTLGDTLKYVHARSVPYYKRSMNTLNRDAQVC